MCQVTCSVYHLNCLHASNGADQSALDYTVDWEWAPRKINTTRRNSQNTYNTVDETDKQESIFPFNLHTRLDSRENRGDFPSVKWLFCNFVRSQRAAFAGALKPLSLYGVNFTDAKMLLFTHRRTGSVCLQAITFFIHKQTLMHSLCISTRVRATIDPWTVGWIKCLFTQSSCFGYK